MKLFAPKTYWTTPKEEIDRVTGGCGPGRFGDWLVPDTIWGLSIKKACRIHDFSWYIAETLEEKEASDRAFLNNMLRLIYAGAKWWILRKLRIRRAYKYYLAVKLLGGPAFWKGKNSDEEEKEA